MDRESSFVGIFLLGLFSMLYGEVFAGASLIWFFDPWGLFVTFPLYWSHVVFFWSLAVRLRRDSLRSLYLFGVVFGLYESWVTKVVWSGFMGQEPILGTFLGFAVVESLLILLFWHPIMSFVLPIVSLELLYAHVRGEPGAYGYLVGKNKVSSRLLKIILFASPLALAINSGGNLVVSLSAFGGTLVLIYLVYRVARKNPERLNPSKATVGTKGLLFFLLYILGIYVFFFFALLPERIPSLQTIFITLLFYVVLFVLILRDKCSCSLPEEIYGLRDLKLFYRRYAVILAVDSIIYLLLPELTMLLFLVAIILMIGTGLYLLIRVAFGIFRCQPTEQWGTSDLKKLR